MFTHLMMSQGRGPQLISPGTLTVSAGFHGLALGLVLTLAVAPPSRSTAPQELVTFLDIEPERPVPAPVAEPPAPVVAQATATPPPPKGFQELVPPTVPPAVIPEIDLAQPAVRAEDFSGVGKVGGVATGVEGGTPQNVAAAPPVAAEGVFAIGSLDYDERPALRNRGQLPSILARYYPKMLAEAGIEGRTVLRFVILPSGQVDPASVTVISTTHDEFGAAAAQVVDRFRFTPGRYDGKAVRVLTEIPITWSLRQ